MQIGRRARRQFETLYKRIDAIAVTSHSASNGPDPYQPGGSVSTRQRRKIECLFREPSFESCDASVANALLEFLTYGNRQELARIRPLVLARRWQKKVHLVIDALVAATSCGILRLRWEIYCPVCKSASATRDSLCEVDEDHHCLVCRQDIRTDFSHAVELTFAPGEGCIRPDRQAYCRGGPAHARHVPLQMILPPDASRTIAIHLCEGNYQVRGVRLPICIDLHVDPELSSRRASFELKSEAISLSESSLSSGDVSLTFSNRHRHDVLVRLERVSADGRFDPDLLCAAQVATFDSFRNQFPKEIASLGHPIDIQSISFVVCEFVIDRSNVDRVSVERFGIEDYQRLQCELQRLRALFAKCGGTLMKSIGSEAVGVFMDESCAKKAAQQVIQQAGAGVGHRVTLATGPAILAAVEGRHEYFGETLARARSALGYQKVPGTVLEV